MNKEADVLGIEAGEMKDVDDVLEHSVSSIHRYRGVALAL